MAIKIYVTWTINTNEWLYHGPGFAEVGGSVDDWAEDIYHRYHRLRDEDRPMLIQVYGSGLGDCLADRLATLGLPAEYAPHEYPRTLIPLKQRHLAPLR